MRQPCSSAQLTRTVIRVPRVRPYGVSARSGTEHAASLKRESSVAACTCVEPLRSATDAATCDCAAARIDSADCHCGTSEEYALLQTNSPATTNGMNVSFRLVVSMAKQMQVACRVRINEEARTKRQFVAVLCVTCSVLTAKACRWHERQC